MLNFNIFVKYKYSFPYEGFIRSYHYAIDIRLTTFELSSLPKAIGLSNIPRSLKSHSSLMFITRSNRKFCQPATLPKILQFGFHFLQRPVEEFTKNKIPSEEDAEVNVVGLASVPSQIQLVIRLCREEEPGKN